MPPLSSSTVVLLADPSPCLRALVLRELLGRPPDDVELAELDQIRHDDRLVADLVALQGPDGSWTSLGLSPRSDRLRATAQALMRLGYLGFGPDHEPVRRGAAYLLSQQRSDGSWPLPVSHGEIDEDEGYSMVPLQTAIPLRGLAACGYATHASAERAYGWLLAQRLDDGAWPTGIAAGNFGYVAGYRRLAHSRWGCRSNTTGALVCLAHHPDRRTGPEARRALDLLLGRETREQYTLGFEVARLIGVEPWRGFITTYARFDLALLLDLCGRVGATGQDPRVAEMVDFVAGLQGSYGLWHYSPRPQASRWVTFDLLRSLGRLGAMGQEEGRGWVSGEPRTPFQPYPSRPRRF